jgi:hypothetical protein
MRRGRRLAVWVLALGVAGASGADVAVARSLDGFAHCLGRQRATLYGTSWCPHCAAQRALFGRAMRWVPYVECSVDGTQALRPECAGITGFPTWTFRDGSQIAGRVSLERLAEKTGCALGEPARRPLVVDVPASGGAVRAPASAGVEIIDVR